MNTQRKLDKDNFNAVMEGLAPSLEFQVESALPGQRGSKANSTSFWST
ncbi:type VI secretion system contractile sheath small subunit [Photorhabdus stackebrandtii]|nr:type VI secretion system contractile sheath small subunit [Photorhabdus stackebrandtii]